MALVRGFEPRNQPHLGTPSVCAKIARSSYRQSGTGLRNFRRQIKKGAGH